MNRLAAQLMLCTVLAGCGASPSRSAPDTANPPFAAATVATFDSPWAMDFLPGSTTAVVTEKPGRIWLIDVSTGKKQFVSGVPRVVVSSQGGLLDIVASPHFSTDGEVY